MPLMPPVELVRTIAPPAPRSIIEGIAVSTVLNTPVRLTSITSCQASWGSSPRAIGAMPAFASTMSTGPSSATPASNAVRRPPSSRTSAWAATIRRSSASTSLTVSARSSSVAPAYGIPGMSSHTSTAMMSAPSWASRTAWLRPWPRAAPVMNATLPATRPAMSAASLLVREAGVDRHRDAGDIAAVVGDQPENGVGDVHRLDHVHRQRVGHRLAHGRVGLQELLHHLVDHHRG